MAKTGKELQIEQVKGMALTKTNIENRAEKILSLVEEGHISPLTALHISKSLSEMAKIIDNAVKADVLDKIEEAEGNKVNHNGAEISLASRASYDYSGCHAWNKYKAIVDEIQDLMKTTKKAINHKEYGQIKPARKSSTNYPKIKLPT